MWIGKGSILPYNLIREQESILITEK